MRNHIANAIIYLGAMLIVAAVFDYTGAEVEYYNRKGDEASERMSVAGTDNPLAKFAIMYAPASPELRKDLHSGEIPAPAGYDPEGVISQGCYGERAYLMADKKNIGVHVLMRWIRSENRWVQYGHTIREGIAAPPTDPNDVVIPVRFIFKRVVALDCRESPKIEAEDMLNQYSLVTLRYIPGMEERWIIESSIIPSNERE